MSSQKPTAPMGRFAGPGDHLSAAMVGQVRADIPVVMDDMQPRLPGLHQLPHVVRDGLTDARCPLQPFLQGPDAYLFLQIETVGLM